MIQSLVFLRIYRFFIACFRDEHSTSKLGGGVVHGGWLLWGLQYCKYPTHCGHIDWFDAPKLIWILSLVVPVGLRSYLLFLWLILKALFSSLLRRKVHQEWRRPNENTDEVGLRQGFFFRTEKKLFSIFMTPSRNVVGINNRIHFMYLLNAENVLSLSFRPYIYLDGIPVTFMG